MLPFIYYLALSGSALASVPIDAAREVSEGGLFQRDTCSCATPSAINYRGQSDFTSVSNSANTPFGYVNVVTNGQVWATGDGYLGFTTVDEYDGSVCAELCDTSPTCSSFQIYFEQDNDASSALVKCAFWAGAVSDDLSNGSNVTASIGGCNSYVSKTITTTNSYDAPIYMGSVALDCPQGSDAAKLLIQSTVFSNTSFDINLCADECTSQGGAFFNTYVVSKNGVSQGQHCDIYSGFVSNSYATESVDSGRDEETTISRSFTCSVAAGNKDGGSGSSDSSWEAWSKTASTSAFTSPSSTSSINRQSTTRVPGSSTSSSIGLSSLATSSSSTFSSSSLSTSKSLSTSTATHIQSTTTTTLAPFQNATTSGFGTTTISASTGTTTLMGSTTTSISGDVSTTTTTSTAGDFHGTTTSAFTSTITSSTTLSSTISSTGSTSILSTTSIAQTTSTMTTTSIVDGASTSTTSSATETTTTPAGITSTATTMSTTPDPASSTTTSNTEDATTSMSTTGPTTDTTTTSASTVTTTSTPETTTSAATTTTTDDTTSSTTSSATTTTSVSEVCTTAAVYADPIPNSAQCGLAGNLLDNQYARTGQQCLGLAGCGLYLLQSDFASMALDNSGCCVFYDIDVTDVIAAGGTSGGVASFFDTGCFTLEQDCDTFTTTTSTVMTSTTSTSSDTTSTTSTSSDTTSTTSTSSDTTSTTTVSSTIALVEVACSTVAVLSTPTPASASCGKVSTMLENGSAVVCLGLAACELRLLQSGLPSMAIDDLGCCILYEDSALNIIAAGGMATGSGTYYDAACFALEDVCSSPATTTSTTTTMSTTSSTTPSTTSSSTRTSSTTTASTPAAPTATTCFMVVGTGSTLYADVATGNMVTTDDITQASAFTTNDNAQLLYDSNYMGVDTGIYDTTPFEMYSDPSYGITDEFAVVPGYTFGLIFANSQFAHQGGYAAFCWDSGYVHVVTGQTPDPSTCTPITLQPYNC